MVTEEPARRVNIYLNIRDIDWLKEHHGWGYAEMVRRIVREHIAKHELAKMEKHKDVL